MLDKSGSLGDARFALMKIFLSELINSLDVDPDSSNIAMVSFSDDATVEFHLDAFETRAEIQQAIDAVPYTRGRTNTALALQLLREQVFRSVEASHFLASCDTVRIVTLLVCVCV